MGKPESIFLAPTGDFGASPSPAEGQVREDVRRAVKRARSAQPAWAALGVRERARFMLRTLDLLLAEQEAILDVLDAELGRPRLESLVLEIFPACDSLGYYARNARKLLADETPSLHLLKNKRVVVRHLPLGVIAVITPWNGPFSLAMNPSVQALMAGNAVILKPSEVTPRSAQLVADLFARAGLPEDLFQVVHGGAEAGAALVEGGVDKVSFTGSVSAGRRIGEACGRNLTPCTLELGGNDAAIVCADADLSRAAQGIVFGACLNAGQVCMGTERVYVVAAVAEQLIGMVHRHAAELRLGPDGELGRIIGPHQLPIIEKHVADAVAKGAELMLGGKRVELPGGSYFQPTLLTNVNHDMLVMREETFGPVIPIMQVADEEEAIRMANDSSFGLSGTIWTADAKKAERLARRLQTGSICVNDSAVTYGIHEVPFGGRKASGLGAVNGPRALKDFCFAQPVVHDRFGLAKEQIWYPYGPKTLARLARAMRLLFGTRIGRWLT
jgi:acyl-CoA reductase-like NAD-dependent aldehyde dehydrogenase